MKAFRFLPLALLLLPLAHGAAEAQEGFSDSFHSTTMGNWWVDSQAVGSVNPQMDGLHMALTPENTGPPFFYEAVSSACKVHGDFDAQVEFRFTTWPPANGTLAELGAVVLPVPAWVQRNSWSNGRELYSTHLADGPQGFTDTTDTAGRLRLTRVGDTVSGYSYNSGSWNLIHSHSDAGYANDARIALIIGGGETTLGSEVVWENLSVTADALLCPGGPFTPTYSHMADEVDPGDPYTLPADDECPVSAPCKTLFAEDIPEGQPEGSIFLRLPSSIINFAGDQMVPDGAIVGRVYGSVRTTSQLGQDLCPSIGTIEPFDFLWYEGTTDPDTTTGSRTDMYSPFHWPTQLNGFRDSILAGNPGAVLHSRWLKQTEGWSVNVLQFKLADGGMLIVPDVQLPGQESCTPTEIRSMYLGLSADNPSTSEDEGGIPLFTCSMAGTQTYSLMLDRSDTPEWDPVVLEDTITCSPNTPSGTDVSVPLNGGTQALAGMDVMFSNVATGGSTTVVTTTEGPPPPTGFEIVGLAALPLYFDINTDASYSGDLTVCVRYDETQVAGPEANLKLMHRVDDDYVDVTTSVDTVGDIICGTTTHLSIFVVAQPLPAVGGTVELRAGTSPALVDEPDAAALPYVLAAGAIAVLSIAAWYARRRWARR
jgi:hypothetical protein